MKKRYPGSGTSGCEEKQEAGDLVGWGMAFLDDVFWTGFAGTNGKELGAGQVYPVRGAEGVGSVASTGESTCTPGFVALKQNEYQWSTECGRG